MNEQNPDIISASLVASGNHHLFQGKYFEAIELFNLALESNPNSLGAYQGRAFCKALLIGVIPIERHVPLIQSLIEDLQKATDLSRIIVLPTVFKATP